MTHKFYPPNPRLRLEREARNWTLEAAARELRTLMASHGETQIGINFNAVSRWERGIRRPGKRYRHYLCLLYGKRPDQLGLLPDECAGLVTAWPEEPGAGTSNQPQAVAKHPTQPPLSVAAGHATQYRCQDGELDALNLTRRKLLAASGLLGAALGTESAAEAAARIAEPLDRVARVASGRAAADDTMIAELDTFLDGFERSHQIPAKLLIEPLGAHINLVKTVLKQSLLPEQRAALLRNASRATAHMAWYQLFDRSDRGAARGWLTESLGFGDATDGPLVHVMGLGRAAELFTYSERSVESVKLLEQAHRLAERNCTPNVRSWVLASQAEAYATSRQADKVSRLLDKATEVQQQSRPEEEPSWAESWGPANVAGYRGTVHMLLEQPGPARVALRDALAVTEPSALKFRSVYLVDLATTYAHEVEIEAACELAGKALEIAGPMHYGTTLERMGTLRRHLGRWRAHRSVRELDERLHTLGTAGA